MTPRIHAVVPFAEDMDYGNACNEEMRKLDVGEWAAILDHDMCFTTPRWHRQMLDAIAAEPEGSFTAVSNRMASPWQKIEGAVIPVHHQDDLAWHRKIGAERLKNRNLLDVTDTAGWGGVVMLISKESWAAAGGFRPGMFCVDHLMHRALRAAGRRIWIIEGLYVYHWRGSSRDREMLKTAPAATDSAGNPCECRRWFPGAVPTVRRQM